MSVAAGVMGQPASRNALADQILQVLKVSKVGVLFVLVGLLKMGVLI